MALQDHLNEDWRAIMADEFGKPYWGLLEEFVDSEYASESIHPPREEIFAAFNTVPYDDLRVVLLGQDPYHGPGQAHGLSFSVKPGVGVPPSLRNIYKELQSDLGCSIPDHGYLMRWAEQGVLLLNTVLTVRQHQANSHRKKGWEKFTDAVIKKIAARDDTVVFLLWGGPAKKKSRWIDAPHVIVDGAHPSPLSAHNGFFGSAPFSKVNAALEAAGKQAIDWQV